MSAPRVGVIGAGQLARMMGESASALGVELAVYAYEGEEPCVPLSAVTDERDLEAFARSVDVLTFDHERLDLDELARLEGLGLAIFPSTGALRFSDKAHQRQHLHDKGLPVPRFTIVRDSLEAVAFGDDVGWPIVLKPATGGYDGKGVHIVDGADAARRLLTDGAPLDVPWVAEELLAIDHELAVVVVTGRDGERVNYPVVSTVQHDGVCREVTVPARVSPSVRDEAEALALDVAAVVGAVGVLAIELFVVDGRVLVNEVAPRPHNSGHITMEASATSQFENHLRAVLGWPLGSPALRAPAAAMVNVFGPADGSDPRARAADALGGDVHLHLYGKSPRPGRKLGHVNAIADTLDEAHARAWGAAAALGTDRPGDER
ncbi:MAG TPA: 5-(carboxyamino)imidazole ribonucleotide synthase [Acidimicrobiales bacterium]|jgi:5-(carboxyamino)imidazole ribonucleotide synthase|nr:5-(carboxyamino)imidazole ribonucleotide synthase [Acidimicrobiales bacterium]